MPSPLLWFLLLLAALSAAAPCPEGAVSSDTHAVGCTDLRITAISDNITLVIERATGTLNVTLDAVGITLLLVDCAVAGNITLRGSHSVAQVLRSTVAGVDVVALSGARNIAIVVADSTLIGAVVASVLSESDADSISITIVNSTLNATRYVASVVGVAIFRNVTMAISDSRLWLEGGDNVGIVALAGEVADATLSVTTTSVMCRAGDGVGVLGAGTGNRPVRWTNVTISAAFANVTVTAGNYVGILGAGILNGGVRWTNVTVAAAFVNVTSTAQDVVGVLGAGSGSLLSWTNVTISAARAQFTSSARDVVGLLGAGGGSNLSWTKVTVFAVLGNVTSHAGNYVGVLGAAVTSGKTAVVPWTDVVIVLADSTLWCQQVAVSAIIGHRLCHPRPGHGPANEQRRHRMAWGRRRRCGRDHHGGDRRARCGAGRKR